jgi:hypothetical protein
MFYFFFNFFLNQKRIKLTINNFFYYKLSFSIFYDFFDKNFKKKKQSCEMI